MSLSASRIAASGASWILGTASQTLTPTDGLGGSADATGANGANLVASPTYGMSLSILGLMVTVAAAGTATISQAYSVGGTVTTTDSAWTFTVDTAAKGWFPFGPEGIKLPGLGTGAEKLGLRLALPAGVTAYLVYKVLG